MFKHYLIIAWRNLLKNKTQSIISVLGLAIGFTAFAFTMSWIRYERGYDKHISNVERVYKVLQVNERMESGAQSTLPTSLKRYLENLTEIEASTAIKLTRSDYQYDGVTLIEDANIMQADTSFFKVFYPDLNINYPSDIYQGSVILSEKAAQKLGLRREDIGQHLESLGFTLLEIISGLPENHTNVPFDIMTVSTPAEDPGQVSFYSNTIYIRVHKNVGIELLSAKLDSIKIEGSLQNAISYILVPLRETQYTYPDNYANIKYKHLKIFVAVSFLVIICALFNYLMLFVHNIRIRSRELALRKVNGASNGSLMLLFITEIGLVLLLSLFISAVIIELIHPSFIQLSEISAPKSFYIKEMILYGIFIFLFSMLLSLLPFQLFNRVRTSKIHFKLTKISLFLQLLIGILLLFCTSLFLYQYITLNKSDIGFNRSNINTFYSNIPLTKDQIQNIAGVEDAVFFYGQFLPRMGSASFKYNTEAGEVIETEILQFHEPEFIDFFEIKITEGRNLYNEETGSCLINETAKMRLGINNPLGEKIDNFTIVGVIKDLHIDPPYLPVLPTIYLLIDNTDIGTNEGFNFLAYKYIDGSKESTEQAITSILADQDQSGNTPLFKNMDELYASYTKSERYLLTLLKVMTVVALLIAIFGIYSMVTLACNRRRKEIAIRKVNGASIKEIFLLFFKQYFWITIVASVVAFPVSVYLMQRWLEQYTRRVSMEWWLFAGVFILVLLIVMASMIFRVMKAAWENPAEVVKSE